MQQSREDRNRNDMEKNGTDLMRNGKAWQRDEMKCNRNEKNCIEASSKRIDQICVEMESRGEETTSRERARNALKGTAAEPLRKDPQ